MLAAGCSLLSRLYAEEQLCLFVQDGQTPAMVAETLGYHKLAKRMGQTKMTSEYHYHVQNVRPKRKRCCWTARVFCSGSCCGLEGIEYV